MCTCESLRIGCLCMYPSYRQSFLTLTDINVSTFSVVASRVVTTSSDVSSLLDWFPPSFSSGILFFINERVEKKMFFPLSKICFSPLFDIFTCHICTQHYLNIQVHISYLNTMHTFVITRFIHTQYSCRQYLNIQVHTKYLNIHVNSDSFFSIFV